MWMIASFLMQAALKGVGLATLATPVGWVLAAGSAAHTIYQAVNYVNSQLDSSSATTETTTEKTTDSRR
jgi:hypothetical protein